MGDRSVWDVEKLWDLSDIFSDNKKVRQSEQ